MFSPTYPALRAPGQRATEIARAIDAHRAWLQAQAANASFWDEAHDVAERAANATEFLARMAALDLLEAEQRSAAEIEAQRATIARLTG